MNEMVDEIRLLNPDYGLVQQISDLGEDEFKVREHQRPAGYSATTRVHIGRLCVPVLNDSGATCSCIMEEQVVVLINHTQRMVGGGLINVKDYNYPIQQFYRYKNPAKLKGAEKTGTMLVEYAVLLRLEFIPEGAQSGPVQDIYFKIFKRGTCSIIGAVLGWPTLDHPVTPGGEGLGWTNSLHGVEYKSLGVIIPRCDDLRKINYNASVSRYKASQGSLMAIDDVTGDRVQLIDMAGTRQLRAAAMMAGAVPTAQLEAIGLEFFVLGPGERAVVPIKWSKPHGTPNVTTCSTHPDAPTGLVVLPGPCDSAEFMSIVIENESSLHITISEQDKLAAGVEDGVIPSLDSCANVMIRQDRFSRGLDWSGNGKDAQRVVSSQNPGIVIIVVLHHVPRFSPCTVGELSRPWSAMIPVTRITTLVFEEGDIDYIVDSNEYTQGLETWTRPRPWGGQMTSIIVGPV